MKLIRFLKTKTFWANILLIILSLLLILWGVNACLDSYTRHGENIKVPKLDRLAYEEAVEKLEELELVGVILDTSEFEPDFPRGSIINQYPEPGSLVKVGREIKLTINPHKARKIEMPQLIEKTKRRAIYDLESKGFRVGELTYVPYLGKDVVVDVKVEGQSVSEKERFDKGTVVDLVLGEGLSGTRIPVPYLRFRTVAEARNKLFESSLNLGSVQFDDPEDTVGALIYKQYPEPSLSPAISLGGDVDVWLTTDYTKIPNDSLQFIHSPDSLANDSIYQTP